MHDRHTAAEEVEEAQGQVASPSVVNGGFAARKAN